MQEWAPGLVAFGDVGGPVSVAFDTRQGPPYPVLAVPFVRMEFESAQVLAGSFEGFIGQIIAGKRPVEPRAGCHW